MIDIKKYNNSALFQPIQDGYSDPVFLDYVKTFDQKEYEFTFLNLSGFSKSFRKKDKDQKWILTPKSITYNLEENTASIPYPGQGYELFFTKEIISKFKEKKHIKTLVLSDHLPGVYMANKCGIDAVGVPNWDVWKSINITELFFELFDLIKECNVESIVLVTSSDSLQVVWKEDLDLYLKPLKHYSVLERLKNALREVDVEIFWHYVHPDLISGDGTFYGLVDTYSQSPETEKELQDDFNRKTGPRTTMVRHNLTKMGLNQIKELFIIHKGAPEFFEHYRGQIGLEPFIYNKQVYEFNLDSNKAEFVKSAEAVSFINVGGHYYKKNVEFDDFGFLVPKLDPFPITGFMAKFPTYSKEKLERLKRDVEYYDKFGNEPEHINYRKSWYIEDPEDKTFTKYYNNYFRIYHKPQKGSYDLSLEFIKHVFGTDFVIHKGQKIYRWELGLDYMKLLYEKPQEILPILSLISEEQVTGKSTFAEWIKAIFQDNVIKVPAADLSSKFTSFYATKLIMYIEEALISKKEDLEKLKDMVTSSKGKLEKKGVDATEVKQFLKVILTSNNEKSFAPIGDTDVRFWIRKLHKIAGGAKYDFKAKLHSEIPGFLYHLQDRAFTTQWEERGWFHKDLIYTEELSIIRKANKSGNESNIKDAIMQYMLEHKLLVCKLTLKDIEELTDDRHLTKGLLTHYLSNKLGFEKSEYPDKYIKYEKTEMSIGGVTMNEVKKSGRTYKILARDLFSAEKILTAYSITEDSSNLVSTIDLELLINHEKQEIAKKINTENLLASNCKTEYLCNLTYKDKPITDIDKVWDSLEEKSFIQLGNKLREVTF